MSIKYPIRLKSYASFVQTLKECEQSNETERSMSRLGAPFDIGTSVMASCHTVHDFIDRFKTLIEVRNDFELKLLYRALAFGDIGSHMNKPATKMLNRIKQRAKKICSESEFNEL